MKANRARQFGLIAMGTVILAFATCCSQKQAPPPAPKPAPSPAPAPSPRPLPPPPLPPLPPTALDWRDAPITPGTWRWAMEGSRSVARFGGPDSAGVLVLSCNRDAAVVTLIRPGIADGQVPMTLVSSFGNRPLSGLGVAGPPPVIALTLPARDSVLDAMAFSRGRFAVETAGLPTLYLPSWPEVSRVIEDCR